MEIAFKILLLLLAYSISYFLLVQSQVAHPEGGELVVLFLKICWPFALFLTPVMRVGAIPVLLVFCLALLVLKRTTHLLDESPPVGHFLLLHLGIGLLLWLIQQTLLLPDDALRFRLLWQYLFQILAIPGELVKVAILQIIGLIWIVWGGTIFVRSVLHPFTQTSTSISGEEYRRGRIIGNLERILIYLLVQTNALGLITLIVGLKAIARFKKLEERPFAEYFLIGTLASLLFAFAVAFGVKASLR